MRRGPNRVGPAGALQSRVDGGNLALEEFRSDQFDPSALPQHPAMKDMAA